MYCYVAIGLARHADKVPEWEEVAAVAAAVQNMQLAAAALGVACYWSSWQEAAREAGETPLAPEVWECILFVSCSARHRLFVAPANVARNAVESPLTLRSSMNPGAPTTAGSHWDS